MSPGHRKGEEKAAGPGKHAGGSGKKTSGSGHILAIAFIFMIFMIPIGLCFITFPTATYTVSATNPLAAAVQAAGASICSTADTQWDVAGATGGKTYVISYNCNHQTSTNTITVQVQAFDSQESRDGAVLTYNTMYVGRGKPVGNLFAYNQYLIYVTPPNTDLMRSIGAELQKMVAPA